jgi:protease-4
MPQGMYPPIMMMPPFPPPPPPRRERSFARAIFMTLATTIFGLSLVANLYLLAYAGLFNPESASAESTLGDGSANQKVAVLPIEGIINGETSELVCRWLRTIEKDENVKAVVLAVNTPGGGVTASDEIYHQILKLKEARKFPIVASMGGLAASGGYYVSAPADRIFAQPTTWTGSIGVMGPGFNASELLKKWGIAETTLTAPRGGYKNAGSMFQPENPRDSAYLQSLVDQAYDRFKGIVQDGRKGKLNAPISDICNAKVYSAQEALANGLIDQIGYSQDAYDWAATQAHLDKPKIVRYHRRFSFMDVLGSANSNVPAPSAKADGINLNIRVDSRAIEELLAPRPMYLWRGQ